MVVSVATEVPFAPEVDETVRPCAPHRYSAPRSSRCSGISRDTIDRRPTSHHWPGRPVAATGGHVPCKSRAKLTPPPAGRHLGSQQAPPKTHPGAPKHPRFPRHLSLSTRHQWFALARLRGSHLPRSTARLSRDAHHHVS